MSSNKLENVQILRALASGAVVVDHTLTAFSSYASKPAFVITWQINGEGYLRLGDAGVDLFFLISGFIMFYSQRDKKLMASTTAAGKFLKSRILRIYPIYWFWLSLYVVLWASGAAFENTHWSVPQIVASIGLYPYLGSSGDVSLAVSQAWTLVYEMWFYLCFGLALFFHRYLNLFFGVLAILGSFSLLGALHLVPVGLAHVATDNILLDFVCGGLISQLFIRTRFRLPQSICVMMVILGCVLVFTPQAFGGLDDYRAIAIGIPCAFILVGALYLRPRTHPFYRLGLFVGDASYSLYLSHGILIFLFAHFYKSGVLQSWSPNVLAPAVILIVLIAGSMTVYIERPLRRRSRSALNGLIALTSQTIGR